MSFQMIAMLVLVAASAAYFGRGFLKGLMGGCEGGCSKCGDGGCGVQKLEALRREIEGRGKGL